MNNIIVFREQNNKIYMKCQNIDTKVSKEYIITKRFKLNMNITDFVVSKGRLYVFLDECNELVLPSIDILENDVLKDLKRAIEVEVFKRICILNMKKIKKSLREVKTECKVLTASALAAAISFTSVSAMDTSNNNESEIDATTSIVSEIENNIPRTIEINIPKLDEPVITEYEPTEEEKIIMKYADMYFISYMDAVTYIYDNMDIVNQYESFELGVLTCLKEYHWNDDNIDKTPMLSSLTEEEKEKIILEFANVYGMTDEETLSALIGVHRLETGYGTSNVYLNFNNCGGVMVYSDEQEKMVYLEYKTFEIGAESFVQTFLKIKNRVLKSAQNNEPGFNINWSLAKNMDSVYCGYVVPEGQQSWSELVEELGSNAFKSGILNDYIKKSDDSTSYIKKKS